MGSMIIPDAYISEAILARKPGYETLARIARAQILTGNRSSHIITLSGLTERIGVLRSARFGHFPKLIVGCKRCGCQAFLEDWVRNAEWAPDPNFPRHVQAATGCPEWRVAFMRRCPGAENNPGELSILDAAIMGRW